MNIVPSQTASASASARSDAAQAAADPADGVTASTSPGFGALLSKSIADGTAPDRGVATTDLPTIGQILGRTIRPGLDKPTDARTATARTTTDANASTDALRTATASVATTDAPAAATLPIGAAAVGDAAKPDAPKTGKGIADDASDEGVSTAGSDLAAQLALVSQWAGLAPQADAVATPRGASSADALDIKGKLDAVRTAPIRTVADTAPAVVDADPAASTSTAAALATSGTIAVDRTPLSLVRPTGTDRTARSVATTRSTVAAALATVASASSVAPVDPKILDLARAIAPDAQAPTVSPPVGDLAGHAAASDTSKVDAFLAQVASQLGAQPGSQFALQAPSPVAVATTTAVAVPTDTMRETVGTPAWSHEVGQVALRMVAGDLQNVSLHLNPEHLGPMDVQVRVDNGVAHLQFAAAHVDTRQALESSRPTLDQLFNDQGIKLGDWSVGQQSSSNASFARDFGGAASQGGGRSGAVTDDGDAGAPVTTATVRTTGPLGLVDTFA